MRRNLHSFIVSSVKILVCYLSFLTRDTIVVKTHALHTLQNSAWWNQINELYRASGWVIWTNSYDGAAESDESACGIIMIICKTGVIAVTNIREEMTKMILFLFLYISGPTEITHLGALAGTEGQVSHWVVERRWNGTTLRPPLSTLSLWIWEEARLFQPPGVVYLQPMYLTSCFFLWTYLLYSLFHFIEFWSNDY